MLSWLWRKKSSADIERMLQAAIAHHEAGRPAEAETGYRRVIGGDARNVDALHFLGFLLLQRGEYRDAVELLKRSLAVNAANPRAQHNLGLTHVALGEREPAASAFREAIRLQPQLAEAHFYLGNLLCDEDRIEEGLACFRRALEARPEYAEARWALTLARLPQVYAAGEDPTRTRGEFAAAFQELERWFESPQRVAAGAAAVGTVQPFSLAYQEVPNRDLLERHGELCARLMGAWQRTQSLASTARRSEGLIRVGIVSAHLREHSVWHAIVKGWFQHLDRKRFSICAFHLGVEDDETRIARSHAAHFDSGPRSLRDWADAILRQRPDVLIYPEVGMDPTALKLAAMRLAPVQACSWGHPETSGLPTMDYYLSAEDLEPADAQANYSEKLVALPHLGCYFEPRLAAGPRPQLRELGLDGDQPLLICPGVPFKYAPQHDWVFPELALRLGRCRFVFFTHRMRALSERLHERLRAAFHARDLDAERFVTFVPWLSKAAFLGLMSQAHVCLDSIGFSGFNTALQSVQAGLPIVAREGRFLRGRLASGILKRLGLPDLIAASEEDYVALVEKIIRQPAYRAHLVARMDASRQKLFADQDAIRGLERFLEQAVADTHTS
jgi:predicted O-linked N-acetylglucosamine transferase (SPINDLY family)